METAQSSNIVLVVADSNFLNLCKDPFEYITRLKTLLAERSKGAATLFTISGKYGVSNIDNSLPIIPVDDKNKTLFGQTLENATMMFDELLAISVSANDPFLNMAREVVTGANKTITQYKYQRK